MAWKPDTTKCRPLESFSINLAHIILILISLFRTEKKSNSKSWRKKEVERPLESLDQMENLSRAHLANPLNLVNEEDMVHQEALEAEVSEAVALEVVALDLEVARALEAGALDLETMVIKSLPWTSGAKLVVR